MLTTIRNSLLLISVCSLFWILLIATIIDEYILLLEEKEIVIANQTLLIKQYDYILLKFLLECVDGEYIIIQEKTYKCYPISKV